MSLAVDPYRRSIRLVDTKSLRVCFIDHFVSLCLYRSFCLTLLIHRESSAGTARTRRSICQQDEWPVVKRYSAARSTCNVANVVEHTIECFPLLYSGALTPERSKLRRQNPCCFVWAENILSRSKINATADESVYCRSDVHGQPMGGRRFYAVLSNAWCAVNLPPNIDIHRQMNRGVS